MKVSKRFLSLLPRGVWGRHTPTPAATTNVSPSPLMTSLMPTLLDEMAMLSRPPFGLWPAPLRDPFTLAGPSATWDKMMSADVTDHGDRYRVEMEIPGFAQNQITISVSEDGSALIIEGDKRFVEKGEGEGEVSPAEGKPSKAAEGGGKLLSGERVMHETVARQFIFPRPIQDQGIKASLSRGVLSIDVPKAQEEVKPRTAQVQWMDTQEGK